MWVRPDGKEMTGDDWKNPDTRALGMLIPGESTDETDERGHLLHGDTLRQLANASDRDLRFTVPVLEKVGVWVELLDSARPERHVIDQGWVFVDANSLVLLRHGVERRTSVAGLESVAHPVGRSA